MAAAASTAARTSSYADADFRSLPSAVITVRIVFWVRCGEHGVGDYFLVEQAKE
jgi:hypothetical protein